MLQFTITTTTMKNWHPRLNQVIYFLHIGSALFELSQNLPDRYKQQTMEEAEHHGGTFLFFTILRAKMQFSSGTCGGQILLSRTFPTISPLTGQEVLVGSNTRFPLTFSIKLIMSAGITVACWIKSFSFRRESLSFSRVI